MSIRERLVNVISPEAIVKAREAQSKAEYSLLIEKRNVSQLRTELGVSRRSESRLNRLNMELSRKLSRLGVN